MKNLPIQQQSLIPIYEEYDTFLKSMDSGTTKLKDYKHYLKQYSFFKNMVDVLPSATYLLNFETQQYPFVSQSIISIMGYTNKEIMKLGRAFIVSRVHPDDMKIHAGKPFQRFIEYTRQLSKDELKNCRFSINFRFKRKDGMYLKILQQYVVLEVNDAGYPLLCLGLITDITDHKADNKVVFSISKYDKKKGFEVISTDTFPQQALSISKREHEVVKHILAGLSSKQTADKLHLSKYTIHAHRRNILHKTNCKNTAELLNYAMLNGLG
jgi:DNA-binding CsgD family transcriptional regulator